MSAVLPTYLVQQQSRCGCNGVSVDVTDIVHLLTLSERDHPGQSEWASYNKLKVLRAKTEFPGEKGILPKNCRNLAYVFILFFLFCITSLFLKGIQTINKVNTPPDLNFCQVLSVLDNTGTSFSSSLQTNSIIVIFIRVHYFSSVEFNCCFLFCLLAYFFEDFY